MAHRRAPTPNRKVHVAPKLPVKPKAVHAEQRPVSPLSPRQANSLEEFGYAFRNGRLLSIADGRPFKYDVSADPAVNQQRYHQIGKLVEKHVYRMLIDECDLRLLSIPVEPRSNEPQGFIFASEDFNTAPYLMIIIHGNGSVSAGQWSRKLIINNGLSEGSQIDYILEARRRGYGVIVTNTNMNSDESLDHSTGLIHASASPEQHGCYVWQHYVRLNQHAAICIVAHSYGGAVVLAMAKEFPQDFQNRVFAIALTDSPMRSYTKSCSSNLLRMLQKKTTNWIADKNPPDTDLKIQRDYGQLRSAGHPLHEWTSFRAFTGVFKFFQREKTKWEHEKR